MASASSKGPDGRNSLDLNPGPLLCRDCCAALKRESEEKKMK
jgi:hypothetical protein